MRLSLDRRHLPVQVFVVVSLVSAIYISAATVNYLGFYPALGEINVRIESVVFSGGPAGPNLSANVTIQNPSDYSGFGARDYGMELYMVHPNSTANQTLFADYLLSGYQQPSANLAPHSTVVSTIEFTLTPQNLTSLIDFNRSYSGQIFVRAWLIVDINTFLNRVTGSSTFTVFQELPLKSKSV